MDLTMAPFIIGTAGDILIMILGYLANKENVKNLYNKLDYEEESYIKPYEYKSK